MNNTIIICTSNFNGGVGRVLSLLIEKLNSLNYDVQLVLTVEQHNKGTISIPDIPCFNLFKVKNKDTFISQLLMICARFVCKFNCDYGSILKYYSRNFQRVSAYKKYLSRFNNPLIISFLNEPIFLSLLSSKNNSVIISERTDPSMFFGNKTTMAFIRKEYPKSRYMVCQSPSAEDWYNTNSNKINTTVIFNPIKSNLPIHNNSNSKKIVNFCRISKEKNLKMLIKAFEKLHNDFNDLKLEIIGNAAGEDAEKYLLELQSYVDTQNLNDYVIFRKGTTDIHSIVKDYLMFVSSSDFEGMSNSMLEAMAMGMPVVCTDCPAGGARAVIKDHENGLLVPVGDVDAMYRAMKELIENPELADTLGKNASNIRETQSVENITNQWLEIIEKE